MYNTHAHTYTRNSPMDCDLHAWMRKKKKKQKKKSKMTHRGRELMYKGGK